MSLETLATELHLAIVSSLDLSGLVRLRQASRYWHALVDEALEKPGIAVRPARVALTRLYLDLHRYESFRASRKHVVPYLDPAFSREAYLGRLREELSTMSGDGDANGRSTLPDMFETWVLEWPEEAVIGWVWPGLDGRFASDVCALNSKVLNPFERGRERWWRTYGRNALHADDDDDNNTHDPTAHNGHSLAHTRPDGRAMLLVQEHGFDLKTFLVLDNPRRHANGGQVWCEGLDGAGPPSAASAAVGGGTLRDQLTQYQIRSDWVAFLRRELDLIEKHYFPGRRAQGRISEADILHYVMEEDLDLPGGTKAGDEAAPGSG